MAGSNQFVESAVGIHRTQHQVAQEAFNGKDQKRDDYLNKELDHRAIVRRDTRADDSLNKLDQQDDRD